MLAGSISQVGGRYNLILNAINCLSGDTFATTQAGASSKDAVLDTLGKVGSEMRGKLGESLGSIQKFNVPVEAATTPSLEALHAYSLGVQTGNTRGDAESISFFKQAIALDPNFAVAYAKLGVIYGNMGQPKLSIGKYREGLFLPRSHQRARKTLRHRPLLRRGYRRTRESPGQLPALGARISQRLQPLHQLFGHLPFGRAI